MRSSKRARDVLDEVGGGDEQHFAQVERHAQVVIGERVVLGRIEHLEQRARGVALEADPQLVHFVEQEHRILRAGLLHPLDDAARHRADVGAAVAADVGFVARAAERRAYVFAPQRPRDRLGDRRLAHARRSDEQQNGPLGHGARLGFLRVGDRTVVVGLRERRSRILARGLHLHDRHFAGLLQFVGHLLRTQLTHGQEFEHPILDVGQPVVVLVENRGRVFQVEIVVGARVPGQLGDPLEIGADDLGLHRLAARALEAAQFTLDLGARFLGQLRARPASRAAPRSPSTSRRRPVPSGSPSSARAGTSRAGARRVPPAPAT